MEPSEGLILALVIVSAKASLTVDDGDHVPCTSLEDPRLTTTCELSEQLDQDYRCWVTAGLTCNGATFVGPGSVCQHRHSALRVYKCRAGQWMDSDGNQKTSHELTKRWGRFRFRIRFRARFRFRLRRAFRIRLGFRAFRFIRVRGSRVLCRVTRWFRRRSCSSPPPSPPPNQPPYFTDCVSRDISVTALPNQLTARVSWTIPKASDPNGGAPSVTQVSGPAPGSVMQKGRRTVIYKARDSGGLSDYCHFTVTVSVTECPQPPHIQHATRSCSGAGDNVYGSVCSLTCDTGYELNGERSVTCQSAGAWNASFPTCQAVSCGAPAPVTSGQLSCPRGHSYPELCVLQCNSGYKLSGSPFLTCGASRQWSPPGSCQDVQAPVFANGCPPNQQLFSGPLESPVTVTWLDPVVTDNDGQNVTLTSSVAKGSSLGPGVHVVRLTAADVSGNHASCNFVISVQVKRCIALTSPQNGRVTCTHGYVEGSECTVACNPGHHLQGDATLRCMDTELWNYPSPACDAVTCPAPVVDHGSAQCAGGLQFQSVCALSCEAGFVMQGPSSVQCLVNATWSPQGTCLDVQPPVFVNSPCQDNIEVYADRPGLPNLVKWTDPPVRDNSRASVTLTSDVQSNTSFPVGVTRVTYNATDVSGNSRTCQFSVTVKTLTCGIPDLEPANRTRTLMTYACPEGYVYGASCTLNCTYGYPLIGSNSITCERDDSMYPPTVFWDWPGPSSVPPVCTANVCPDLKPPKNGALACFLGNFGYDCLMSCQSPWDVPAATDGHFYCTNSDGFWVPSTVPDCVVRLLPGKVRLQTDVFYFTSSCNTSLDELRQKFITRLSSSLWKDACVNVPTCTADNVQVFCGELTGRRKRSLEDRVRRSAGTSTHYIQVTVHIGVDYVEGASSKQDAFQAYMAVRTNVYNQLVTEADSGLFNLDNLVTDGYNIQYPVLTVDCPPGSIFPASASSTAFSCVGCSKGYYLLDAQTGCQACPVGSYTELDNATSCTACPPGWSTPSTASQDVSQCQELCSPGTVSADGFTPCQPCLSGYYQSREGSVTCDLCPPGTWTSGSGATGPEDCVAADVDLSNSSVSLEVGRGWTSLTVWVWLHLDGNSSVHLNLTLDTPGGASSHLLTLYTDGADIANLVMGSSTAQRVEAGSWSRVLCAVDAGNSVVTLHLNNVTALTSSVDVANSSAVLNVSAPGKGVLLSGVRAEGKQVSQAEITAGSPSCMGNNSANLMTWTRLPTSLVIPSQCDAVDECLSSPCGSQGSCQNQAGGFQCVCRDGWSGTTCSVPPDHCYLHQCQNGATCQPDHNNYTCVCDIHHSGDRCQLAKVEGGWGEWLTWSDCSATCGGQKQRQRRCDNPQPSNGGSNCTGNDTETLPCGGQLCPVDGDWGQWGSWTTCSATCEGGEKTRQRLCDNPAPLHGGLECEGPSSEAVACATDPCPVHGGWNEWSDWAPCSVTCGDGQQSRDRSCDNPAPANGGNSCNGSSNETATCNLGPCPVCAQLHRPQGAFLTCTEEQSPYLMTCNVTCLPGYLSPTSFPLYTCGEESGYVWNHQRDQQLLPDLPSCTRPTTIGALTVSRSVPMDAACDETTSTSVQDQVLQNLRVSLPCASQNLCYTEVSPSCLTSRRRKRSSGMLKMTLQLHFDFGNSTVVDENNTDAFTNYEEQLSVVEQSFFTAVNDTASLFTVVVGGRVITPDVTKADSGVVIYCPIGSTAVDMVCVQCPAGSMEVDGECVLCPLGQYQNLTGSSACLPCPHGRSWDVMGATDVIQCQFDHTSSGNKTDDGADDGTDVGLVVGVVCGAAALVAVGASLAIYKFKQHPARGQSTAKYVRPASVVSNNRVFPATEPVLPSCSPPPSYWDAVGRATPSNFQLTFKGRDKTPVD